MVSTPLTTALVFLISAVFDLYILLVMMRFLIHWIGISFRGEPILQFLLKVTDPPLQLLYNFIPGWRRIDFAAIVFMIFLRVLRNYFIYLLYAKNAGIAFLFIISMSELFSLVINIFFWAILIQVIISWLIAFEVMGRTHLSDSLRFFLERFTDPILGPFRRLIPPVSGIDFSPLVAILVLQLIDILVTGYSAAFLINMVDSGGSV